MQVKDGSHLVIWMECKRIAKISIKLIVAFGPLTGMPIRYRVEHAVLAGYFAI